MKTTQYTPGPWTAKQVAPQSQFSKFYVWQIVGEETECAATLVCTLPDYSKDNIANARLIASAPRLLEERDALLETCQELLAMATELLPLAPNGCGWGQIALDNAREVIAKSTGGQS